jgi:putative oxidoreductase
MNLKRIGSVREYTRFAHVALLALRLVAGLAFALHGWSKIQNPFGWMGPDSFAPPFLQALAALSEFGGGIAWMLGFLMPLACIGIGCTMAVAFWMHAGQRGDPFVSMTGGPSSELAAIFLCIAFVLAALGPGALSIDRLLFGRRA